MFNVELKKGQTLSQVFTDSDIITGLVFEHMSAESVVIQKLDIRATLQPFPQDVDIDRICTTL